MAHASASAEPSMEEILASIRRIISEDDQPAAKAAEPPLDLTEPVEAPPAPATRASRHEEVDDLMVFDADPEPIAPPAPAPRAAAPQPALRVPEPERSPEPEAEEDAILSEQAFAAAAQSFTRLAGTMRIAGPGQTLEGLVREMLRPMLKEWLDEHLPPLVEAKVDAEVQRITKSFR